MTPMHYLLLAGTSVIVALAIYAAYLWRRVWALKRTSDSQSHDRNARLAGDIQFIAKSMIEEQCPWIEGSIRIKVLLDNYTGPRREDLDSSIFDTIYEATSHIPTHSDWKDLSRAERDLHRRHMDTLEKRNKDELLRTARNFSQGLT